MASKLTSRPHGSMSTYQNYGCRCSDCTEAWRVYYRQKVAGTCPECGGRLSNRYQSKRCWNCYLEQVAATHGTETSYKHCRCDQCRSAASSARRARRLRAQA